MTFEYLKLKPETITAEKEASLRSDGWEEVGRMSSGLVRYRRIEGSGPSTDDVMLKPVKVVKRFGVIFK